MKFTVLKSSLVALAMICAQPSFASQSALIQQKPQSSEQEVHSAEQRIAQLSYQAQDTSLESEVRVQALQQLARYPSQNALVAVARATKDDDDLVREAAAIAAQPYSIEYRWRLLSPLIDDQIKSVRMAVAANLVRDYSTLDTDQQKRLTTSVTELIDYLDDKKDTQSRLLLADVYRWFGKWQQADVIYQALLANHPDNVQVWLSLADNYRAQGHDKAALETLNGAIERHQKNAALHYSKALTLVRLEQSEQAADEMKQAAELAQDNSYYWYLNGVLQEPMDVAHATRSFEKAYLISGAPEQLYALCDIYVRHNHDKSQQCLAELETIAPAYVIEQLNRQSQHAG
ncbi:HEAT repeat domain-containing protein [Vibrio panuliri]|uniref:Tetratricopeptide repeat protein n=1 Tax=Vibrio panuliri TaxID=1381081 RepID=A0ABX3FJD9_9VIBR|nr:HEAT repeat domain-containing protein [Vibrio panuliri]KAB1458348.1 hypothetical protein F7O85_05640 [Vibrio panuliri]OLQ92518.1 hypothetical protein BIY20_08550 [Vibrio panuliri]